MGRNNKGFGIIEIVLIVAALAIFGFVGWKAWDTFFNNKTVVTTQSQQINTDQAPVVTNSADLDKSIATLDVINIDSTESTQLDSQINF